MAYDKKYIGDKDKVKPYLDDREDRIEQGILKSVDSGAYGNGRWIKFANGDMLFWGSQKFKAKFAAYGSVYRTLAVTTTPPHPDMISPIRTYGIGVNKEYDAMLGVAYQTMFNACNIIAYTNIPNEIEVEVTFQDMGRWK